jgi:hypothetical protein
MRVAGGALLSLAGLAILANAGFSADAADQPISSKGHWHVDFDRSSSQYGPHPKSVTLDVISDDERTYEATETVVEIGGKIRTEHIKVEYDGKPYPIEGSPDHITISMTRLTAASRRIELNTPIGFHAVIACSLSDDLNVMTCDETDTDPKGRRTSAKSVYVRDTSNDPSR